MQRAKGTEAPAGSPPSTPPAVNPPLSRRSEGNMSPKAVLCLILYIGALISTAYAGYTLTINILGPVQQFHPADAAAMEAESASMQEAAPGEDAAAYQQAEEAPRGGVATDASSGSYLHRNFATTAASGGGGGGGGGGGQLRGYTPADFSRPASSSSRMLPGGMDLDDWITLAPSCDSPKLSHVVKARFGVIDLDTINSSYDAVRICQDRFMLSTKDCSRCLQYKRAVRDKAGANPN